MSEKICISDMTLDRLTAYIVGLGQPKFRAKQIFKWLHQKLVTEFAQMTDRPKHCCPLWRNSVRLRHRRSAAASNPGTAPSNIFWNWPMETASKPF